jgi:UPF0755 protein
MLLALAAPTRRSFLGLLRRLSTISKFTKGVLISLSIFIIAALLSGYFILDQFYAPCNVHQSITVVIPKRSSFHELADYLVKAKVIDSKWLFIFNVRTRGKAKFLKAGEYCFPASRTPSLVMNQLIEGKTLKRRLTIPEGLKSEEIVTLININEGLSGKIDTIPAEGSLLPETYYFSFEDDREDLLGRMKRAREEILKKLWEKREVGLPLRSPEEAVILASIIEKETGIKGERKRIAGVFINRLRKKMPLQADPTVIYGLEKEKGVRFDKRGLSQKDLSIPTAYNTYIIPGLPPAPICNPGYAAIEAVLHPQKTDDLFFVADGTGGHVFSKSLKSHQLHHQKWRKIKKQATEIKQAENTPQSVKSKK